MNTTALNATLDAGRERALKLEKQFERAYLTVFREASHRASKRFEALAPPKVLTAATNPGWTPPSPDELVADTVVAAELEAATTKLRKRAFRVVTEQAARDLEISFDLTNPMAEQLLEQVGERAGAVTASVKEELTRIVQDAYRDGLSVPNTAKRIWEAADPGTLTAAQAQALARTDLNMVANGASLRLAKAAKAAPFKQWITAGDERVREAHVAANGQTVPIDQPFSVGGESLQHPGDPAGSPEQVFNCRCAVIYTDSVPAVTAAARPDVSDLAMVAVYPRADEAQALAVEDGNPPETMHVTLVFLGEADQLDLEAIGAALATVAAEEPPLKGVTGGAGAFADLGDGAPQILLPDVQGLAHLRERAADALAAIGVESPSEHGWLPHMTLRYTDQPELPDDLAAGLPLHFDQISLVVADARTDYKLGGTMSGQTAAAVTVLVDEGAEGLEAGELVDLLSQLLADVATFAASAQGFEWNVQGSDYSEHRALFAAIHADTASSLDQLAESIRQQGGQPPFGLNALIGLRSLDDATDLGTAFDMSIALRAANEKLTALLGRAHALATSSDEQGIASFLAERIEAHQRWETQLRSTLTAAVTITVGDEASEITPAPPAETQWVSDIGFEGVATADGRYILPDALDWREPPLTLMAMTETGPGGHEGAFVAGRMDTFEKDTERDMDGQPLAEGVVAVRARGIFDDGGEDGTNVARLVDEEIVRGISVDLAIEEWLFRDPDTGELLEPEEMDDADWERAFFDELQFAVRKATILAATVCPTPAFDDARIAVTASGERIVRLWAPLRIEDESVTASAAGLAPEVPPREWFETPEPDQLTPLTVTAEGRVYGHAFDWTTCHTGIADRCVMAPRSPSGYSYFRSGEVITLEGDHVPVGQITLGIGHADTRPGVSRLAAAEHYDNTDAVVADVTIRDGRFGGWVAGAARAKVPAERVRELRAAKLSGDWRTVNGRLELIGLLAVNVPGFPIPRPQETLAASADGVEVLSLVAAGIPEPPTLEDAAVRRTIEILAASASADPIGELAALAGVSG